jgi:hypothetical protein
MKKIILIPAMLTMFLVANSQQDSVLKSKKGKVILPEKKDFAIGISANSFLNYFGNLLSSSGNNRLNMDLIGGNSLYGKYFLNKKNALRLRLYLNVNNAQYISTIPNDLDPVGLAVVNDKLDTKSTNYNIALGYERRHGKGRLQIFGGAEFLLFRNSTKSKYQYGNAFSTSNPNPNTTTNFNNNGFGGTNYSRVGNRTTDLNNDSGLGYGGRAFFGLEYFIFPKISVAGEFGVFGNVSNKGVASSTSEYWNFMINQTSQRDTETKADKFVLGSDNLSGQIALLFYFK